MSDAADRTEPAPQTPTPPTTPTRRSLAPWVVVAGILVVATLLLRAEGLVWWCACGRPWPWITDVWTSHCSQHLADPYSITHVSHGLIFYGLLALIARRLDVRWRLGAALTVAAGWEILENSPIIIERYRSVTMSLEYMGDSVVNAVGDIGACALGFFIARWLGLWWSVALFVATEIALLVLIRDNLTLNVLMLIYPIPAIKEWQSVGHL